MLALYRSGRQAEALEVYQAGRRLLAAELGLEPSEPLKRLERMILGHDPVLDASRETEPRADSAEAPRPPRHGRRTVTMLLAAASPDSAVLDPERFQRITSGALDDMQLVLEHYGGSVERLPHGGVSAVFGAPLVHEDDALRAVRAAVELRERVSGTKVLLRVGVDTGEVVTDGEHSVIGEAVASAARLQQAAGAGEILIGTSTLHVVGDAVVTEPAGDDAHRVLAARPDTPRRRRAATPMIGRRRERRRLRDAFEQAVDDASCQLFTVLGVAGVGKSRLVEEFLDELVGERASIARGRCLPYGEGITYWPVVEAIRDIVGEPTHARLLELVGDAEEPELVARRVAGVIGITDAQAGAEEASWAIRSFFEALARRRPLLLVFDDIHWGEPGFLDLVAQFADWSRDVRLCSSASRGRNCATSGPTGAVER